MKPYLLIFLLLAISCTKDEPAPATSNIESHEYLFADGFETSTNNLSELLPINESRWTNIQQVDPSNGTNEINLNSEIVSEGTSSLRMFSNPSDDILSKIDIEKFGFQAFEGDTIRIEADFYIANSNYLESLFLIDLECCSCWDPDVPDNQCPGVRLKLGGGGDYLSIERGKINETTLSQNEFSFPKNQWVNVIWEMILSTENNGSNKLIIDGITVINSQAMNMPNQEVFGLLFASEGIDFQLQQPLQYERFQIGATANPTSEQIEMFIDNVSLIIN